VTAGAQPRRAPREAPPERPVGPDEVLLTHEFVDALARNRKPAIDVYESLAYTVPGIVAHQSALKGGETLKIPSFDPA